LTSSGFEKLGPEDLEVEAIREHEDVLEEHAGFALFVLNVNELC